jgi:hypothetical protein
MNIELIIQYTAAFASIGGLIVSVVTFFKVISVKKAQERERRLVRELYGIETLTKNLRKAASSLGESKDSTHRELASILLQTLGRVEGINRALGVAIYAGDTDATLQYHRKGYFTTDFVSKQVMKAAKRVDILCYRNMIVSGIDVLEALQTAAARGVRIRILALSSNAPECVMRESLRFLPSPSAEDTAVLAGQVRENESRVRNVISSCWSQREHERFEYRGYGNVPGAHFVRVDDAIHFGFLNTCCNSHPKWLAERPYVLIPGATSLGEQLTCHFDILWKESVGNAVWPEELSGVANSCSRGGVE